MARACSFYDLISAVSGIRAKFGQSRELNVVREDCNTAGARSITSRTTATIGMRRIPTTIATAIYCSVSMMNHSSEPNIMSSLKVSYDGKTFEERKKVDDALKHRIDREASVTANLERIDKQLKHMEANKKAKLESIDQEQEKRRKILQDPRQEYGYDIAFSLSLAASASSANFARLSAFLAFLSSFKISSRRCANCGWVGSMS